jgi:hypothetical protein
MRYKRFRTTHCGKHARMAIPYDPSARVALESPRLDSNGNPMAGEPIRIAHDGETASSDSPVVVVCAVDDCVGLWPRFAESVSDRSYQS